MPCQRRRRLPLLLPGLPQGGYDRHIDLTWAPVQDSELQRFTPLATQRGDRTRFEDFLGASGKSASYKASAVNSSYKESALSETISGGTRAMSDVTTC